MEKIKSTEEVVKLYGLTPYIYPNLLAPQSRPLFDQDNLPFSNTDKTRSEDLLITGVIKYLDYPAA